MKTKSQIENEIWTIGSGKTFSGKESIVIINRFTGEEKFFELTEKRIEPRFIINDESKCELDPEDYWGCGGFRRMLWAESKISEQTKEYGQNE